MHLFVCMIQAWCQEELKKNWIGYLNKHVMKKRLLSYWVVCIVLFPCSSSQVIAQAKVGVMNDSKLKQYVNYFNDIDSEYVRNFVPNDKAFDWLSANIPLFECPDTTIEKIY